MPPGSSGTGASSAGPPPVPGDAAGDVVGADGTAAEEEEEEVPTGAGGWVKDGTWTTREVVKGALVLSGLQLVAVELGGVPEPRSLREVSLASNALTEIDLTPLALCPSLEVRARRQRQLLVGCREEWARSYGMRSGSEAVA